MAGEVGRPDFKFQQVVLSLRFQLAALCAVDFRPRVGSAFSFARRQKKSLCRGSPTIMSIHLLLQAAMTRYGRPGPARWVAR